VAEVGPEQAQVLLGEGAVLLDVREPDEWAAGHAPGAVHVPLGQLGARLAEIPSGTVVVVCRSGARSARAAAALLGAGRDARNLAGGMQAWAGAGLAVLDDAGTPGTVA
jgi:rhodanese-related sulfurtransferase